MEITGAAQIGEKSDVAKNPPSVGWKVHPPSQLQPETPMDGHSMGTATDVNLYTSFTFTRTLLGRRLNLRPASWVNLSTLHRREEHGASDLLPRTRKNAPDLPLSPFLPTSRL
jgi:hypothetical protein